MSDNPFTYVDYNVALFVMTIICFVFLLIFWIWVIKIMRKNSIRISFNDKLTLLMIWFLICQFAAIIGYYGFSLKTTIDNEQAKLCGELAAMFLTFAIILNLRIWIFYFIKIGKDSKNPYVRHDSNLFDVYAPDKIAIY